MTGLIRFSDELYTEIMITEDQVVLKINGEVVFDSDDDAKKDDKKEDPDEKTDPEQKEQPGGE